MEGKQTLFSKSYIFTLREDPKIADCLSHKFLLKGCFLYMVSSGIYSYLPLGLKVLNRISSIIKKYMDSAGADELIMTALQPIDIWQKTGRDKDLAEVMFRFKDRKNRDLCLGPTHEEEITEIVRNRVVSYKQLPLLLYQIQTKFRDEPRPRFGLVRSCEFVMKDAYSFDVDEEGLDRNYQKMLVAYQNIFKECGLDFVTIEADSGVMGGKVSHEFMVPAPIGEDILFYCDKCQNYFRKDDNCPNCNKQLQPRKMIEIGHIFKLGTKYSVAQQALFLDRNGKRQPVIMGCYGIGVSRLLPAIVEVNHDEKGIIWPRKVSPYDVSLLVLDKGLLTEALHLSDMLTKAGFYVLIDERDEPAGVKFNDAYLIGNPYILILGKNYSQNKHIDLEIRKTKQKMTFTRENLMDFLEKEYYGG
jgi:prolyl-tRNA synthetase